MNCRGYGRGECRLSGIRLTFYLYLNDMDGDFLDDNGYSREEVLEGMKDLASDWGVSGLEAFN